MAFFRNHQGSWTLISANNIQVSKIHSMMKKLKVRFKPNLPEKSEVDGGAICGQSYKHFTLVNYDSRVVKWGIFQSGSTLES